MTPFYHGWDTEHWTCIVGCDHGERFGCLPRCWAAQCVAHWGDTWGIGRDFHPRLVEKWLNKPLSWRKPQVVAAGFMGDIACLWRGDISAILKVIRSTPQHTYLLLTKDPLRFNEKLFDQQDEIPPNAIMMATVRNQEDADRVIPALLRIPAARFGLSLEPLLSSVDLDAAFKCVGLDGGSLRRMVSWVVVGCESGRGARWGQCTMPGHGVCECHPYNTAAGEMPVHIWTRALVAQCRDANVPVMVKQLPVFHDGKWAVSSALADFPPDLQVAERPEGSKK